LDLLRDRVGQRKRIQSITALYIRGPRWYVMSSVTPVGTIKIFWATSYLKI